MSSRWNADRVLELARQYKAACVIVAAAELDLIPALSSRALNATALAGILRTDERATAVLADALSALGILIKRDGRYEPAPGVRELFDEHSPESVVMMLRHQANCLRNWSRLAEVVQQGRPVEKSPSIRGADEDRRSFIEAMDVATRSSAPAVVDSLEAIPFRTLLDLGGGPGTWTIAFLKARPEARAIYFDLPEVLPIARRHFEREGLLDRIEMVGGDYLGDEDLPRGADLAWVSSIAHQNSRSQNRELFRRIRRSLLPGGRILVRDLLMDEDRVSPLDGALFAVNMLVHTEGGGSYTRRDYTEDLVAAGFQPPVFHPHERLMDQIVEALAGSAA